MIYKVFDFFRACDVFSVQKTLKSSENVQYLKIDLSRLYQPSGAGGTRSPPATPHRVPVGPKMTDGVWKEVKP